MTGTPDGTTTTRTVLGRCVLGGAGIAFTWLAFVGPESRPTALASIDRSHERASGQPLGEPSERHRAMADCLWPAARNHGFYALQEEAASNAAPAAGATAGVDGTSAGTANAGTTVADAAGDTAAGGDAGPDHALWRAFLASTGADICGYTPVDLVPLTHALAATREAAGRHFTASREPFATAALRH